MNRFSQSDEGRRDELIRIIEHSVEKQILPSWRHCIMTWPQNHILTTNMI